MSTPQVSIITAFLDAERFIADAIESVLAQTVEAWELILVDDGSTDESTAIAQRYARQHPERIRYVTHPGHAHRGMSASRNLGIVHAQAPYIAFLDAHHAWMPRRLEAHAAVLERRPRAAMVYGPTLYWHSWADHPTEFDTVGEVDIPTETLFEPPYLLRRSLTADGDILPGLCSLLVRRSVVGDVAGFEETFRGTAYEDRAFLSKVCLHYPVYVTEACLDRHRQPLDARDHPQVTASDEHHAERLHSDREQYLNWLADYLAAYGVHNPVLWTALHQELWPYRYPLCHRIQQWWQDNRMTRWTRKQAKWMLRRMLPATYGWARQQEPG